MSKRPLLNNSIADLEKLSEDSAGDIRALLKIEYELAFRKTERAQSLAQKIRRIREQFKSTRSPSHSHTGAKLHAVDDLFKSEEKSQVEIFEMIEKTLPQSHHRPIASGTKAFDNADARNPELNSKVIGDDHQRLVDLLDYVRHMGELTEKPVFRLAEYQQLFFHEMDLVGRTGISFDLVDEEGPVWLRIDRIKRTDPPNVPEVINEWLSVSRDPSTPPTVRNEVTKTLALSDADSLVLQGLVDPADVMKPIRKGAPSSQRNVIFRLELRPDIDARIREYLEGPWYQWSQEEIPRRETIRIYDSLFATLQSINTEGADQPLEIVWGVGVARWLIKQHKIDHPLIEQLVELHVDVDDGAITLRPRQTEPQLALKPYAALENHGVESVLQYWRAFIESRAAEDELTPFDESTFEPVLKAAVMQLDQSGRYTPDTDREINDRSLPKPEPSLAVSDTWVVYVRRRSESFFVADLNRLKNAIGEGSDLPGPAVRLVREPAEEPTVPPIVLPPIGGPAISAHPAPDSLEPVEELFFPKAFNAEQISIVRRLETSDGVVVQGPPGTGKTHTIANIICHYLATGRRVLVTSKGEPALTVLKGHLPNDVGDLAISLLSNERAGLKQLERAVSILANTANQLDVPATHREVVDKQQRIVELKGLIERAEAELRTWAQKHLTPLAQEGDEAPLLPMEIARRLTEDASKHEWFPDELCPSAKTTFESADLAAARNARKLLGPDLVYGQVSVPDLSTLPDSGRVAAAHEDLIEASKLRASPEQAGAPRILRSVPEVTERLSSLLSDLERTVSVLERSTSKPWLGKVIDLWRRAGPKSEEAIVLGEIGELMRSVANRRITFVSEPVEVEEASVADLAFRDAVSRGAARGKPIGFFVFGGGELKEWIAGVRVLGMPPRNEKDWAHVLRYLDWRKDIAALIVRWRSIANELGLPDVTGVGPQIGKWAADVIDDLEDAFRLVVDEPRVVDTLGELFPYGLDTILATKDLTAARTAKDAVAYNLALQRLEKSRAVVTELSSHFADMLGPVANEIREFIDSTLGNAEISAHVVNQHWQAFLNELERIRKLSPLLQDLESFAQKVSNAGAPNWAAAIRTQPVIAELDAWTPEHWAESWRWARQKAQLKAIDGRDRISMLASQLIEQDRELRRTYEQVVCLRTHLSLKQGITERVASALSMFITAIRGVGKGTGVRARRFRRDARGAMERCYAAVPCWIMPTWRVSESLPATLGSFDLVIVDEASQSDVGALPALLRGKKVLVVGDDKQVSPTAAFIEERKLLQLKHSYLREQPFAPLLLPGSSLYSLAQAIFPAQRVMLREHFRCVEPIIRFSFQFYTEDLIPLRIPKSSERLDPPLIDIYVANGVKDGRQINIAEAEAIVDEIELLIGDPDYVDRSMGVVSLVGGKQAHFIQNLLLERIGEEAFLRHEIACGDSATFQGKERDIMFISMVESPSTARSQTSIVFQQRFNVALSRARDRQYLFRSVTEDMLKPDDLKAKILRHFKSPMEHTYSPDQAVIDMCESSFERDVFKRLVALGYVVTPQVKAGAFRIDLVVDGENDRRLAIELDGDQYHTPDRWADDFARQRTLERVGWRFWRCWGSSFALDPDGCIADLVRTLDDLEIRPSSKENLGQIYTQQRTIGLSGAAEGADLGLTIENEIEPAQTQKSDQFRSVAATPVLPGEVFEDSSPYLLNETVLEAYKIQAGDRVLISYNDEPTRQYAIELSEERHDPDSLVVNINMPLGRALEGWCENDEVEIPAGGGTRVVTILSVERPVTQTTEAA